jgi:hypothetical protein
MKTYTNDILGEVRAERIDESNINPELKTFLSRQGYDWLVHAGDVKIPLTLANFTADFTQVRQTA